MTCVPFFDEKLNLSSRTENESPDVKRKVTDERPFIYTPLAGEGTNRGEEYYQE